MKKIVAAFVNQDPTMIGMVYTKEQQTRLSELCDFKTGVYSKEDVCAGKLADAEAIFSTWGFPAFSEAELDNLPKLKGLFYAAGATDAFARPFFAKNIPVLSAWRMNAIPVAEFCEAAVILALKGFYQNFLRLRVTKDWKALRSTLGPGSYGETVALIGAGAISTLLKDKLENHHDLKVIVVPSRPERRTISITDAFSRAQVVSNHLPNRDDNVHVIGRREFECMRPGAVFINTGRGAQVDEAAMADVFRKRPDLTAILDVFDPEPPRGDSPLWDLPNVIMTTHIAGSMNDEFHRMSDLMIHEVENLINGRPFENQVSESMLLTSSAK